ncbi:MAG: class I SAM-dependent methyltransferase, partial [Nitrospiraceae bacterium]|nr:class I SAM-dependent methyltransferase [Nitrospiraceae bacterium]
MAIGNWIDRLAGPLSGHDVLDLFSGCGSVSAELSSLGVGSYTGVDLNGVLVKTANDVAAPRCAFQCSDVFQFVARSDLSQFTAALLLYEALNGLRRSDAAALIGILGQRLRPGAWVFGDIRDLPHMVGSKIELTVDCPYMALEHGDVVIREYGYTSKQEYFGSRYIKVPVDGRPLETALSILTLIDVNALDVMLARAGMTLVSCCRLIIDHSTDVPESAQNLFFAARV